MIKVIGSERSNSWRDLVAQRWVLATIAGLLFPFSPACADDADAWRGRTVTLYIGTGAGGGYDAYGRLVARHIGRFLPGSPSVVAQNMPGASSLLLANYLYNKAPRDGTAIGVINQAMPVEQFLGSDGVAYDAAKLNWIGRASSAVETGIVWHTSPIRRIEDTMARETIVGGTGPTSSTVFVPYLLDNLAGTKFKVVTGFNGTNEIGLAMERGEIEGSGTPLESLKSYRASWLRDGKIRVIVLWSARREPEMPDVPSMVELGRDESARQILRLYASADDIGRSVVAPPGIPGERLSALRRAFDAAVASPELRADAAREGMEIKPLPGADLQDMITGVLALPHDLVGPARAARQPPGG